MAHAASKMCHDVLEFRSPHRRSLWARQQDSPEVVTEAGHLAHVQNASNEEVPARCMDETTS